MLNVWLAIMAAALVIAAGLWIGLIFRADRRKPAPPQESSPRREVIGGKIRAHAGGRQVMPDPREELAPEAGPSAACQASGPATAGHAASDTVLQQVDGAVPDQAPAAGDRS